MRSLLMYFKTILLIFIVFSANQSQASEPVDFTIDLNGVHLKGKFYVSAGTEKFPTLVLLHGFPGGEQDVLGIGKFVSGAGINVMTFNYSGTHKSEGKFSFENTQKDIQAAFEFIHQPWNIRQYKIDTTCIYLGGYSYGGGMALTYAANHPEISSVFSVAGNDHGAFMKEYNRNPETKEMIDKMFDELKGYPETVRFGTGSIPKEIAEQQIIELNPTLDLRYCAPMLASKNILLIGGWDDHNVSVENIILPLYRALMSEHAAHVTIKAVQDNHTFKDTRTELAQIISGWLKSLDKE
jgi:pimeloyl-ACP methyl ester carboxylesterase